MTASPVNRTVLDGLQRGATEAVSDSGRRSASHRLRGFRDHDCESDDEITELGRARSARGILVCVDDEARAEIAADLRDSALILARVASDTGARTDLDAVIELLGFTREVLESELD